MHLLSAMFRKEMIGLARRRRYFVLRAVMLGVMLLVVYMLYSEYGIYLRLNYADLGHDLFLGMVHAQIWLVMLLTPALIAPVIATEKERDTLGLLMMTNLGPFRLVRDKVLSRLALTALYLLAGIPLMLALLVLGGITPAMILRAYMVIFGVFMLAAGTGLAASAQANSFHAALMQAYLRLMLFVLGVLVLFRVLFRNLNYTDIVEVMAMSMFPFVMLNDIEFVHAGVFLCWTGLWLLGTLIYCAHALFRILERGRQRPLQHLFARLNRWYASINYLGIIIMREHAPLGRNPLAWWETRRRFFCSGIFLIRACAAMICLLLTGFILMLYMDMDDLEGLVFCYYLLPFGLVWLSSSLAFNADRKNHRLDLLLSTPVTGGCVINAKIVGVLKPCLPLFLVMILMLLVICRVQMLLIHVHYACHLILILLLGLGAGLRRRNPGWALLDSLAIVACWSCSLSIPIWLFDLNLDHWGILVAMIPYSSAFAVVQGGDGFNHQMMQDVTYALPLLLLAITLLYAQLVSCFDAITGRV